VSRSYAELFGNWQWKLNTNASVDLRIRAPRVTIQTRDLLQMSTAQNIQQKHQHLEARSIITVLGYTTAMKLTMVLQYWSLQDRMEVGALANRDSLPESL